MGVLGVRNNFIIKKWKTKTTLHYAETKAIASETFTKSELMNALKFYFPILEKMYKCIIPKIEQFRGIPSIPFLVLDGFMPPLTFDDDEKGLLAGKGFIDVSDFFEDIREE